jgi:hypothetical protein
MPKGKGRRKVGSALTRAAQAVPVARCGAVGAVATVADQDFEDIALAWARGEVSITQVSRALFPGKQPGSNVYGPLARGLRAYVKRVREDIG